MPPPPIFGTFRDPRKWLGEPGSHTQIIFKNYIRIFFSYLYVFDEFYILTSSRLRLKKYNGNVVFYMGKALISYTNMID